MTSPKQTILVVEDEKLLLAAIKKKLIISGFEVVACQSGQAALEYLNTKTNIPVAIWLDYWLGDMTGLDFAIRAKKKPSHATIPIIVVSNSVSPDKVSSLIALGIDKYILKAEYRLDDIIEMIKSMIKSK